MPEVKIFEISGFSIGRGARHDVTPGSLQSQGIFVPVRGAESTRHFTSLYSCTWPTASCGPTHGLENLPIPKGRKIAMPVNAKHRSTGQMIRKLCLDGGHATTERRQDEPTYPVDGCPREAVDSRGPSRSTYRAYWKQCCPYIAEAPCISRNAQP